jgi:hypothetical protein
MTLVLDLHALERRLTAIAMALVQVPCAMQGLVRLVGLESMIGVGKRGQQVNDGQMSKVPRSHFGHSGRFLARSVLCSPGKEKTLEIQAFMEWVKAEALR